MLALEPGKKYILEPDREWDYENEGIPTHWAGKTVICMGTCEGSETCGYFRLFEDEQNGNNISVIDVRSEHIGKQYLQEWKPEVRNNWQEVIE